MTTVNIYLNFNGNCEEAFNHYKSVFGGEFPYVGRFGDMPAEGGKEMPESMKNQIMHISLPIGGDTMIMGSDVGGKWAPSFTQGNNFSISINTDSKANADKFFNALSAGGVETMAMNETFWGDYFGMCTDKFGVNWMISFPTKPKEK